ncbi:hypothetical protein OQA88_5458 [Cercophora sp. LCS_1]
MQSRVIVLFVSFLLWLRVSCNKLVHREEAVQPKDVWDTGVWGGLPPLNEQEEVDLWDVAPYPRPNLLKGPESDTTLGLPNPCTDAGFHAPVYEYHQWRLRKVYLNPNGEYPLRYQLTVTLRDGANNYSMQCAGTIDVLSVPYDRWRINCVPESEQHDDRFQGQVSLSMWLRLFEVDWLTYDPLSVTQYWHCPPAVNVSSYPGIFLEHGSHVYKAYAGTSFNGSCPKRNATDVPYVCNITTLPSYAANFTQSASLNVTEILEPRPLTPTPEERVDPPPARDCTDVSLTYPDWTIEGDTIYVPSPSRALINQTTLNFTLASRATGISHFCRWGGRNLEVGRYSDELQMVCSAPPGSAYDASGTAFRVIFGYSNRELSIAQNWTCGNTKGDYSRKFQAREISRLKMPLFCADDGGRVCRANRQVVKGQLIAPVNGFTPSTIPPPPGAMQPGCTARSGTYPSWFMHFRFEETRYGRASGNRPLPLNWQQAARILQLEIRNEANNYTQRCTISTYDNATVSAQTWRRCFPDTGIAQRYIETYLKFNQTSAELRVNQTWFCSDTDPSQPLLYQGTLTYKVPTCGETKSTAPGSWPQCRDFYQTRWCEMANFNLRNGQVVPFNRTVSGTTTRTERLPSNALTDPDPDPNPAAWGCTADSAARPVEWRLRPSQGTGDVFWTSWPSPSYSNSGIEPRSTFSVELNNSALAKRGVIPAVGATASWLTPYFSGWQPAFRFALEPAVAPDPKYYYERKRRPFRNVVNWGFRFDAESGYLELDHSWFCNDKNPERP